ncbi:hypothetical protein QR680_006325 [Steinernema hermaphroditum]|uniref:Uncharacterized protein n=1 Tax=Steinernema hermaphroditum TaxID=289476 RepID=A0AA39LX79_9BILA|nr:hypothetical protein QR680_006325 [Steinernema hermaphroditum]
MHSSLFQRRKWIQTPHPSEVEAAMWESHASGHFKIVDILSVCVNNRPNWMLSFFGHSSNICYNTVVRKEIMNKKQRQNSKNLNIRVLRGLHRRKSFWRPVRRTNEEMPF